MAEKAIAESYDVVIIGGGFSGLAAADALRNFNPDPNKPVSFLVLDWRDRLGGRTETVGGTTRGWLDLGGAFIAESQFYIQQYIDRFQKPLDAAGPPKMRLVNTFLPEDDDWIYMTPEGKAEKHTSNIYDFPGGEDTFQLLGYLNQLSLFARAELDAPGSSIGGTELDAATVWDVIQQYCSKQPMKDPKAALAMGRLSCRAILSAEPEDVSMLFLMAYAATGGNYATLADVQSGPNSTAEGTRLAHGTHELVAALVDAIGSEHIATGMQVTEVDKKADGTFAISGKTAGVTDFAIDAKHVIVAMSPVVARNIKMSWLGDTEEGKSRQALSKAMFMGHTIKGFLTYKSPFWRDAKLLGYMLSSAPVETYPLIWTLDCSWYPEVPFAGSGAKLEVVTEPFCLMTFIVGKAADIWASPGKSFEERREAIVNQLVAVFGPKARTELIDGDYYVEKDWSGTVSGGCPTGVLPPNVFGQHGAALRRPIGNMHFAGSESATAWAGYMNGAIQSGIRAASEVFLALQ